MGLRSFAKRLSTSIEDLDAEKLRLFCASRPEAGPIRDVVPRSVATVMGEIQSVRIVPRAGSPWLEATVSDGTDAIVVIWTGRTTIAGVAPGRRLLLSGRAMPIKPGARRLKLMNPAYELLMPGGH